MSKLWEVAFEANPFYLVEADTEEEAIAKAYNWFVEYIPEIACVPYVSGEDDDLYFEEEDEEPCCADCGHKTEDGIPPDSHCFWCNEYSEFQRKNW